MAEENTEGKETTKPAKDTSKLKWYIVNTQTSCEQMAKASIEERIRSLHLEDKFGQILIPSENVVELVKGKKATRSRKFFPGYIFVQMQMEDSTWHIVKNASKVTGFVGGKVKPPEVPEEEVMRVTKQMEMGAEKSTPKVKFSIGENVTVIDGPFSGFNGAVEEINQEKGKVKVLVSIFGRPTPVELFYRPQFYFRTTDVTGVVTLKQGTEMVMPGDRVEMEVELIAPIAMEKELRFAVREGGRTVGAGVVTAIVE